MVQISLLCVSRRGGRASDLLATEMEAVPVKHLIAILYYLSGPKLGMRGSSTSPEIHPQASLSIFILVQISLFLDLDPWSFRLKGLDSNKPLPNRFLQLLL